MEAVVAALLKPRRLRLFLYDYIPPRGRWSSLAARWALKRVEKVLVVRRGDATLLTSRFGVDPGRIEFVPFPVTLAAGSSSALDGEAPETERPPYVYSAGASYRDYPTLVEALRMAAAPAVITTDIGRVVGAPEHVERLSPLSPADGRELMRSSTVVAVAFEQTLWPTGPLIILDALRLGKPVVTTACNGSLDYVVDGVTGYLVPPGDATAFAERLSRLLDDPSLRESFGRAAADHADSLSATSVTRRLLSVSG